MILALLLIVVLAILTLTSLTVATGQLNLSSDATARNNDLQGALAGVQAAVGEIRAANQSGYVVPYDLPCTVNPGYTNTSDSPTYTASIQYYDETPQGSYVTVSCTPGDGPATLSGDFLAEAVVSSCSPSAACPEGPTSTPENNTTWRRLVSTYQFDTSIANIPGGLIYSYSDTECLLADGTPSTGMTLQATTSCSTTNSMEQFQYTADWNLAILVDGSEYCIQDPEDTVVPLPSTGPVSLGSCTSGAVDQWGIDDSGEIEGVSTTGDPNTWCLENTLYNDPDGPATNASVVTCVNSFSNETTWYLSPTVGAGASQPPSGQMFGVTNQMVNFLQFGLCMDVTNQDVSSGFLIDYMCKQFPDYTQYPTWNQRWCFDQLATVNGNPVGVLYTPDGQTTCSGATSPYCLTSPLATAGSIPSEAPGPYVTVTSCNPLPTSTSTAQTSELWTEWGSRGGSVHEYTWTDNDGYCLEANPANLQYPSGNSDEFATIQVNTCNSSYQEKWNAPATFGSSEITNTHEEPSSGA